MGKYSRDPHCRVFTFRTNAELGELIERAAGSCKDLSEFLREAAKEKAVRATRKRRGAE